MSNRGRSWMYKRMSNGILNKEYVAGVLDFINHCEANPNVEKDNGKIRCPCKRCQNGKFHIVDEVKYHLITKGFTPYYENWVCHGERHDGSSTSQPPNEATSQVHNDARMGDYTQMLMDAVGPEFAARMEAEEPNPQDKKFYDLLNSADRELWQGCKKATQLSAVARMLTIKAEFNLPERWFDVQCQLMHDIMPEDNCFVKIFYETKKLIESLGLPVEKIDCCQLGCMLYWREDANRENCKFCEKPRYWEKNGKRYPFRYMFYFPLTPRLKRLYVSSQTASFMRWHTDHEHANPGDMCHPCDSEAWRHFNNTHPSFASEARNVRLGLCTDGFQPFGQSGKQYSCWPVVLTPYNLPPSMCLKDEYIFLSIIVPGGANPKQKIDVYLQPLIDELNNLWTVGVETYDASRKENFVMRAALMWTIGDLPAYGMMSGWGTSGKTACPVCLDQTVSFRLPNGMKQSWFDTHRRFLPADHPFRRDKKRFKKNQIEDRPPPRIKSALEALHELDGFGYLKVTENDAEKTNKTLCKVCGWRKKSIFWDLPYWKDNLIRHNLDVMHIEKNVFDNVFNTVMDVQGKTKDGAKARADMTLFCDRKELEFNEARQCYPRAVYTLDKAERKEFLRWVENLRMPDGYVSNLGRCVDMTKHKMYGMKSHDCHVFMQRLIPIGFRELLPKTIWEPLTELSNFFHRLTSRVITVDDMDKLRNEIAVILCKLETIFVPGFFNSMEHLPIHLPYEAKIAGPVQFRWMYPFERVLNRLKRMVKNKAHVEGSICNAYLVREASFFCSHYFEQHVFTRGRNVPRQDDGGPVMRRGATINIFNHPARLQGKRKRRFLTLEEKKAIHKYFLLNTPEIEPFIVNFEEALRLETPHVTDAEVASKLQDNFPTWFSQYAHEHKELDRTFRDIAHGPVIEVETYTMCFINGYRFHTENHGSTRATYNSGVCINGGGVEYYGKIQEILEVEFPALPIKRCVMFKCDWYDPTIGAGTKKHEKYNLVEIHKRKQLRNYEPFILAIQAEQVCYIPFPSMKKDKDDWLAVSKVKPRGWIEIKEGDERAKCEQETFQDSNVEAADIEHVNIRENINLASTQDGPGDDSDGDGGIPLEQSDDSNDEEEAFLNSDDEHYLNEDTSDEDYDYL